MSTAGPSSDLPEYGLIEEPTFEASGWDVEPSAPRFDELIDDLKWRLARDPYRFTYPVPGKETRVTFEEVGGFTLRVFFRIEVKGERKSVVLLWVDEAEDDEVVSWGGTPASDDIPF